MQSDKILHKNQKIIEMKKEESPNSYRSILKGTSIFGGVQIFNILINLIRGKFVAIILGPEGMGITSLFNSASNTIQRFASLGLNQPLVREIASSAEQPIEEGRVLSTGLVLIKLTSILGLLVCVAFCKPLSYITFGDSSYAWQFILLGAAVGLFIAANGKLAILQGLHQVKKISKASIVGGLSGLLVGVPFYYIFGDKGIVPAIVAISLSLYIFYTLTLRKITPYPKSKFSFKGNYPLIKKLILLGMVLMASDLIGSLVNYLLNLFIRVFGSVDDVGLFQAANSVANQYAGLVFAALAMDYYPRLAKVSDNNKEMVSIVNRQTEIVSLLIAPAMSLLILSAPLIIRVLLSDTFEVITPLMRWMGLGILLKALSFPMGYIAFAKGNKKVFLILEGISGNLLFLTFGCLGFYFFGLIGLGYALVVDNFISIIIYYIVNHRLYEYRLSSSSFLAAILSLLFGGLCFGASFFTSVALSYIFMSLACVASILWTIKNIKAKLNYSYRVEEDKENSNRAYPS